MSPWGLPSAQETVPLSIGTALRLVEATTVGDTNGSAALVVVRAAVGSQSRSHRILAEGAVVDTPVYHRRGCPRLRSRRLSLSAQLKGWRKPPSSGIRMAPPRVSSSRLPWGSHSAQDSPAYSPQGLPSAQESTPLSIGTAVRMKEATTVGDADGTAVGLVVRAAVASQSRSRRILAEGIADMHGTAVDTPVCPRRGCPRLRSRWYLSPSAQLYG